MYIVLCVTVSALLAVGRCPLVCPSVTFVYCVQTAEDRQAILSRPASPIILVFDSKRQYP